MSALPALFRLNLSLAVALTAAAGYFSATHELSLAGLAAILGTFFLAAGASGLNQFQERNFDSLMPRTILRPLPRKVFTGRQTVVLSLSMAVLGTVLLATLAGISAATVGLFTLIWYNGVYTPLKRRTGYAFLIGALCGALPPLIGILAVSPMASSWTMVLIALFMYFWQIAHTIQILHARQHEYKTAGLPLPLFIAHARQAEGIVLTAILFTVLVTTLFPLFGIIDQGLPAMILIGANVCVISYFCLLFTLRGNRLFSRLAFWTMLIYQIAVVGHLIVYSRL